jgi:hypothetical protein
VLKEFYELEKQFSTAVQNDLDYLEKSKEAYFILKERFKLTNLGGNDAWYGDGEECFWGEMIDLGGEYLFGLTYNEDQELVVRHASWADPDCPDKAGQAIEYVAIALKNTFEFIDKHKVEWEVELEDWEIEDE